MKARPLSRALIVLLLLTLVGCGPQYREAARINAVNAASATFLKRTDPAAEATWDLTDRTVFGVGRFVDIDTIAAPAVNRLSESPPTYEVTRLLWVKGRDREGRAVRQERRAVLKVVVAGKDDIRVEILRFDSAKPLEFGHQAAAWLGCMVGMIAIVLICCGGPSFYGKVPGWLGALGILVVTLPAAIYFAIDCFGTWAAVLLAVPVHLVVLALCLLVVALVVATLKAVFGGGSK